LTVTTTGRGTLDVYRCSALIAALAAAAAAGWSCTPGPDNLSSTQSHKLHITTVITSAKEVMWSSLFVCLLATLRKNFPTD